MTINPAPLRVAAADATRVYGDTDPTFSGTITGVKNGDSITATYASAASAASAVGSYAIVPTLVDPGSKLGNYSVTSNNGTLTITLKTASVTPNAATKVYGSTDPTLTGTLSGFLAADGVTATYARTPGETVAGSPYAISATLSPTTGVLGNYSITYGTAAFTINRAVLTVTANDAARLYGGANPAFTASYSGFRNGETLATSVAGSPSLTTTAGATSSVGAYAITAAIGSLSAANYVFAFVNGTLTINKADTTTTVTSSLNPSFLFETVKFTATVAATPPGAGAPSGTIQFQVDGANSGGAVPLTNGSASFSTSSLSEGPHTITAIYSGDGNFNGSRGGFTETTRCEDVATSRVKTVRNREEGSARRGPSSSRTAIRRPTSSPPRHQRCRRSKRRSGRPRRSPSSTNQAWS